MENFQAYHNRLTQQRVYPSTRGPHKDEGMGEFFEFERENGEVVEISYTIIDGDIELDGDATIDFTKDELDRALKQAEREENINVGERAITKAGY